MIVREGIQHWFTFRARFLIYRFAFGTGCEREPINQKQREPMNPFAGANRKT